jgi:hypothetical protein
LAVQRRRSVGPALGQSGQINRFNRKSAKKFEASNVLALSNHALDAPWSYRFPNAIGKQIDHFIKKKSFWRGCSGDRRGALFAAVALRLQALHFVVLEEVVLFAARAFRAFQAADEQNRHAHRYQDGQEI